MPRRVGALIACLLTAAAAPRAAAQADKAGIEFFETHVRPVLTDHCVKCHGPTAKKGGLRLDSRAALLTGGEGGPVVKPGDPNASRLVRAVHHATPQGNRTLQAFLGEMLSNEYDLEGTGDHLGDWRDFFIANKATAETMAGLHSRSLT